MSAACKKVNKIKNVVSNGVIMVTSKINHRFEF